MDIEMGRHAAFRIEGRVYHAGWNGPTGWGDTIDTVTVVTDGGAQIRGIPVSTYISDEPTVSPDLVDRMVRLVRVIADYPPPALNDPAHDWWKLACIIAADLPPEPVNPLVQRAREICDAEGLAVVDDGPTMRAVLTALRESRRL